MAYLRGTSSAQTTLIAHLRSVNMQIKLSFNYRWVRPQDFTLRQMHATPQQRLKRTMGQDAACCSKRQKRAGDLPGLIMCLCLQALLITHSEAKFSRCRNPDPALFLRAGIHHPLCPQAQAAQAWGSVNIPPVRMNRHTGKLMSWVTGHAN